MKMDTLEREREIQQAWAAHHLRDKIGNRIPGEAHRQARAFRRSLAPAAEAVAAVVSNKERWRHDASRSFYRSPARRARAIERLRTLFSPATVEIHSLGWLGETALISNWLEPVPEPLIVIADDPGFTEQAAIIMRMLSLIEIDRSVKATGLIGLEVADHALGRLFERSPDINVPAALNQAAAAFMQMDIREVAEVWRLGGTLVLPPATDYFSPT